MYGLENKEKCMQYIKESKIMLDNIDKCDYKDLESISSIMAHIFMSDCGEPNVNKYAFMLLERVQKEKINYIINHPLEEIKYI